MKRMKMLKKKINNNNPPAPTPRLLRYFDLELPAFRAVRNEFLLFRLIVVNNSQSLSRECGHMTIIRLVLK